MINSTVKHEAQVNKWSRTEACTIHSKRDKLRLDGHFEDKLVEGFDSNSNVTISPREAADILLSDQLAEFRTASEAGQRMSFKNERGTWTAESSESAVTVSQSTPSKNRGEETVELLIDKEGDFLERTISKTNGDAEVSITQTVRHLLNADGSVGEVALEILTDEFVLLDGHLIDPSGPSSVMTATGFA